MFHCAFQCLIDLSQFSIAKRQKPRLASLVKLLAAQVGQRMYYVRESTLPGNYRGRPQAILTHIRRHELQPENKNSVLIHGNNVRRPSHYRRADM